VLLLLLLFFSWHYVETKAETQADWFIIQYADGTNTMTMTGSSVLIDLIQTAEPRFVLQYATAKNVVPIISPPANLINLLQSIEDRFVLKYAEGKNVFFLTDPSESLVTLLQSVEDRFVLQYANASNSYSLSYPTDLVNDTSDPVIEQISHPICVNMPLTIQTNEFTLAELKYGLSPDDYTDILIDNEFRFNHTFVFNNLQNNVTYYYQLTVTDRSGNEASQDGSFDISCEQSIVFSSDSYSVSEAGGSATITVKLSYPSSSTITVNYATSNGTATASSDYSTTSGTLTFLVDQVSKTFEVPIINDSLDELNETVNLTLSIPVNATLGSPNSAVLTIMDDDPPSTGTLDPLFPQQWGLHKIEILDAWSQSQGSSEVTIAVIDTGTDYTHIDLGDGKIIIGIDQDYVNDDDDAMDDHGHGTHVGGIAAANTYNGIGIAGVCPACRILPLKALSSAGSGRWDDIATAIRYAVDHGVEVINMSLGGDNCTTDLAEAINYAYERNVTIVAASGNSCPVRVSLGLESFDVSYPAQFERVIAVGATDAQDNRATFSHYGSTLDVTAPGVGILSTYLNRSYKRLDGTSMASPIVAGLAGLLVSQYPSLTPAQVQEILEQSADDIGSLGWDEQTGWGRINADQALQTTVEYVTPAPSAVCPVSQETEVKAFSTKEEDLLTLYTNLRDEVLMPSEIGMNFVNTYYEYGPELAGILLTNSDLRDRTAQFLDNASEEFGSLLPGSVSEIRLTQTLYDEADALVHDLAAAGSDDFKIELLKTWADLGLDQHIDEITTDIWEQMNQKIIYLPIIQNQ
jgi:thermitase